MKTFLLPPVYAIVNVGNSRDPLSYFENLCRNGVQIIQLRAKGFGDVSFIDLAHRCLALRNILAQALEFRTLVIINDSPSICAEVSADGVHLGQDDASPAAARELLGPDAIIGYSTHNLEQLLSAPSAVLDYLALGPIFLSPTKSGHAPVVGLDLLRQAAQLSALPLVAIGGISSRNVQEVYRAGANCAAVVNDLQNAPDLQARMAEYRAAWDRC